MDFLGYVTRAVWMQRANWLENIEGASRHPNASYLLSDQATLHTYDVHRAFCAGAWVSVIVLCHAAIDATIRDTETGDYRSNSKTTFGSDPDLDWLRLKRNRLVHTTENSDPEIADFDVYHNALEADARRAIQLLFRAIYASPAT